MPGAKRPHKPSPCPPPRPTQRQPDDRRQQIAPRVTVARGQRQRQRQRRTISLSKAGGGNWIEQALADADRRRRQGDSALSAAPRRVEKSRRPAANRSAGGHKRPSSSGTRAPVRHAPVSEAPSGSIIMIDAGRQYAYDQITYQLVLSPHLYAQVLGFSTCARLRGGNTSTW